VVFENSFLQNFGFCLIFAGKLLKQGDLFVPTWSWDSLGQWDSAVLYFGRKKTASMMLRRVFCSNCVL